MFDIASSRVGVLLNRSSGSCDAECEAHLRRILEQGGIAAVGIECVESDGLRAALDTLSAMSLDVLIVLGGDGTIRTAAERCGAAGIALIALPGGTMNMLPKALYGDVGWQQALAATLDDPKVLEVSGGEVEDHRFFCAGIFGAPSLWSKAREAVRANRLADAWHRGVRAFHRTVSQKVRYRFGGGGEGRSAAVAVICPLVSAAMASDAPALEAAALDPAGAGDAFRLAWNAVFADWRADPSVATTATRLVRLSSRGRIPAILDGETVSLARTAEVRFVPCCFKAVVPGAL